MSNRKRQKDQHSLAEELQDLVLKHARDKLTDGSITAGEFSTVVKLLQDQGWTFDPSELPVNLKEKLTQRIDPMSLPTPEEMGLPEAEA